MTGYLTCRSYCMSEILLTEGRVISTHGSALSQVVEIQAWGGRKTYLWLKSLRKSVYNSTLVCQNEDLSS